MHDVRPLNIPVILGTSRKGRASVHAAKLLAQLLNRRAGVCSAVVDIASLPLPVDDAGEAIKQAAYSEAISAADGLVIVAPEYNHSFPGLLKHTLDSCLNEYIHKAVGLVGVSAGPFAGIRVVQSLLPVMRELGLVTIFWDIRVLRHGREQVTIDEEAAEIAKKVPCPNCGSLMTHHADKVVPAAATSENEVVIAAARACGGCGAQQATLVRAPVSELP